MTTPITGKNSPVTGKEEGELSTSDDEVSILATITYIFCYWFSQSANLDSVAPWTYQL